MPKVTIPVKGFRQRPGFGLLCLALVLGALAMTSPTLGTGLLVFLTVLLAVRKDDGGSGQPPATGG